MNSMKSEKNGKIWFLKGMKHGIPSGLGYFAVSFTLGIASKKAGLSAFQAAVMSAAMMASAGQFAGIGMIAAGAGYLEMAVTTLVVNMRYLLMSSALSQKVRRDVPFYHRFLMAYEVTDEIFGIAVSVPEKLHPAYMYGAVGMGIGNLSGSRYWYDSSGKSHERPECSSLWDVHGSCDSALQEKQGNCRSSSCFYDL